MNRHYDHAAIEQKWKQRWEAEKFYEVDPAKTNDKFYVLDMFPYPSGEGLSVGHWRGYVLSDFYTRYHLLHGKEVLHPMGFDAFGLPAENAAIRNNIHPKEYNAKTIPNFIRQLKQTGAAYDWSKTLDTSDPAYYKWTQWLFLQFFKHGLAEKRTGLVNWCPKDQTVLANEQVVDGTCERCGTTVTKKELSQWYLKTTEFADELLEGLDTVNWSEHVKTLQRNWIGRSVGAEVNFEGPNSTIKVFTTRPDTIFGVTALVLAPEHPAVEKFVTADQKAAVEKYLSEVRAKTNIDRQQQKETAKTAVFSGEYAVHPFTGEKLPIWIADYVLMEYGTGAVMCVPAHDERDFQFAKTHDLPIKQVVAKKFLQETEPGIYRPDEPTVTADGVIVLVKHWAENKYVGLKWKDVAWGTLLTGSVDEGLTPEEVVLKEIREETGYINPRIRQKLAVVDGLFYHVPKKTNKLVHGHVFLAELIDDRREPIAEEEASKHEVRWLTIEELADFLTPPTHQYAIELLKNGYQPHTGHGSLVNSEEFTGKDGEEAASEIVAKLEKLDKGKKTTTYRLRDWLVSRQRYWGAPIPVVYDPDGKPYPVKDEHLPLLLPEDVDFLPGGGQSPLAKSTEYVQRAEQLYGQGWRFDTDTLDTFVDSSWYFLRYLTPGDDQKAFDPDLVKKWLPVDLYIGGIEHATLHLLYARFVVRFLAKFGYIDSKITEPFQQLFNIGMINLNGTKMSKSKGNIVSPDDVVEHYGTDALRGYELFIGPMDVEAEWKMTGINGIHRFLIKLFKFAQNSRNDEATDLERQSFDRYLNEIRPMIESFRLNTVISAAMKYLTQLEKSSSASKLLFGQFVITLSPVFPYLCEEIWEQLGNKESIFKASWPEPSSDKPIPTGELSVRVNHRHVGTVETTGVESEEEIRLIIGSSELSNKLADRKVGRIIYKPGQFIDFIEQL